MDIHHRARWATLAVALAAALLATLPVSSAFAQEPAAAESAGVALTPEELEQLVARIALYPDDLVALILPASTNPLQIVQADRYLAKRKTDPKAPLDDKWDDSVKSLLNYPEIVTTMSGDLDWTAALGEAVVADQGEVLEAVQAFRRKTQSAGNLKSDPKQTVVVEQEVIKIVPADPQVIYVPQYNPATVVVSGGYSSWGYYPSPYPVYYYPYAPGAALATGLIWGAAIGAAWNGGHWGANYGGGNNNININRNTNINTGDINRGNVNRGQGGGQGGGGSQWKPNKQPGQVSKSVGASPPARVGDRSGGGAGGSLSSTSARQGGGARPTTGDVGGRGGGGAGDAGGRGGGGGGGAGLGGGGGAGAGGAAASRGPSASPSTRGGGGGGGGFDGYGSSRQTQMNSSRGASSRSAASPSMSGRSAGGGGAARGGGGGGGGRRR